MPENTRKPDSDRRPEGETLSTLVVLPADHLTVSYVPADEEHPANALVAADEHGNVVLTPDEVNEMRRQSVAEAKKAQDEADKLAQREAAKAERENKAS